MILNPIRKIKNLIRKFEVSRMPETSVFIVSYPKSGRTWLRVLIGQYLKFEYGLGDYRLLDTRYITSKLSLPVVHFSHASSFIYKEGPLPLKISDKFSNKKIIFITREPKDVLSSLYYHYKYRDKKYDGDISEFIRDKDWGSDRLFDFSNMWSEYLESSHEHIKISYEELSNDTFEVLKKVLIFLEFPVNLEHIALSVKKSSLKNMRKYEKGNKFSSSLLSSKNKDPRGFKVRKGIVGGYKADLSLDDINYINNIFKVDNEP